VIAALFAAGSQGVQEDGPSIVTHFPPGTQLGSIRSAVMSADPRAELSMTDAPDVDYSEWRAAVSAHRIGNLVVTPPWLAGQFDPRSTIVIDPVMAFGTGEHATTRGVLRLMQGMSGDDRLPDARGHADAPSRGNANASAHGSVVRPGDVVADLGAGSAVLSIAAAKLGARRVVAIEIDHDAIENAEQNVRANDVSEHVEVIEGDAGTLLPLLAPVRVVLANIISSVLIEILPTIRTSLDVAGRAILSGILREEREMMLNALEAAEWIVEREDTEDEWWTVQIALR
jgi:ribosomal protein L11 methyltransferase